MDKETATIGGPLNLKDTDLVKETDLDEIYEQPAPIIKAAVLTFLHDHHLAYLKVASFFCIGTGDEQEISVSPRGGDPGFIHVIDRKTLVWPEWAGNNKVSTLKHLTRNSRIGLLFLHQGLDSFMRIDGRAVVTRDAALRKRFEQEGKQPKVAIVMQVESAYFHCGRAINRSRLWDPAARVDRKSLPSMGQVLKDLGKAPFSAEEADTLYKKVVEEELYET